MRNAGSFGLHIFPSTWSIPLLYSSECGQQLYMKDFMLLCDMRSIEFIKAAGRSSWQQSCLGVRRVDESQRFNLSHHKLSHLSVNVGLWWIAAEREKGINAVWLSLHPAFIHTSVRRRGRWSAFTTKIQALCDPGIEMFKAGCWQHCGEQACVFGCLYLC